MITLNVRGKKIQTLKDTIAQIPVLDAQIKRWHGDGDPFIDVDMKYFRQLLNYVTTKIEPKKEHYAIVAKIADYFGVIMPKCPWVYVYNELIRVDPVIQEKYPLLFKSTIDMATMLKCLDYIECAARSPESMLHLATRFGLPIIHLYTIKKSPAKIPRKSLITSSRYPIFVDDKEISIAKANIMLWLSDIKLYSVPKPCSSCTVESTCSKCCIVIRYEHAK